MPVIDKPLPVDPAAERAVVGSLLIEGNAVPRVSGWLRREHFYDAWLGRVYDACLAVHETDTTPDILTVRDHMVSSGADRTEVSAKVASLVDGIPDIANLESYAQIVKRDAHRRDGIRACEKAQLNFFNNTSVTESAADLMNVSVEMITNSRYEPATVHVGRSVISTISQLDQIVGAGAESIDGLPSGYFSIDDVMGGWTRGAITTILARPSVGKTSLAQNAAIRVAERGGKVLFFSMDMTERMMTKRCLSIVSGVEYEFLTKGRLPNDFGLYAGTNYDELLGRITKAGATIRELPIQMNYADRDIAKIMAEIRIACKTNNRPDMVIIDYVQMVTNYGKFTSRHHEIENTMNRLLALTKSEDIAMLLLSQTNRGLQRGERPTLDLAKESGSITEVARNVFYLDRPWWADRSELACKTIMYALKMSEGNPRDLYFHFNAPCYRFEEHEHDDRCPFGGAA